jgi:hypothetical protein
LFAEATGLIVIVLAVLALRDLVRAGGPFGLLAAPAVLVLLQMISVGAGKPGEYGRFAIYPATVLAICAGVGAEHFFRRAWGAGWARVLFVILLFIVPINGARYLAGFWRDATPNNSRMQAAAWLKENLDPADEPAVGLLAEPAPYRTPPMNLFDYRWYLLPTPGPNASLDDLPMPLVVVTADDDWPSVEKKLRKLRLHAHVRASFGALHDPTVISWANKPIFVADCTRLPGPTTQTAQADPAGGKALASLAD